MQTRSYTGRRPTIASPSLRNGTIAFVTLVCFVVVALTARQILDGRASDVRVSQQQTTNLAQSLAQQVTDSFQTVDAVLYGVRDRVETEGTDPHQMRRLRSAITAQAHGLAIIHNVFVISAGAASVMGGSKLPRTSFAKRAYYIYHRTHADRGTHIGAAIRSRTDGTLVITASQRLNRRDGSFRGVIVAAIQVRYFQRLYERVNVGKAGVICLTLADGTILISKPFNATLIGRSLPNAALSAAVAAHHGRGTFDARSAIDGVSRFFAFSDVDRYPLRVVVGLSQDEVLAEWRWQTLINLSELAAVVLLIGVLGSYLVRQIRLREAAEAELTRLALVDGLTGLGNRRRFDEVLEREWQRGVRAGTSLAFLMIDVDDFKAYNDNYGHRAGDRALKTIAACIATNVTRSDDLAARYGGEEFAVILPSTDARGAYRFAEKIRAAVLALRIAHAGSAHGIVTISVGAAGMRPLRGSHPGSIVDAADSALYEAKRAGRNRTSAAYDRARVVVPGS